MNKKAIELSINFLVIVILSLVMLSSGILLVKNFFNVGDEIKSQLDDQTIKHIEELLDEGDPVSIPLKRKTIEVGEGAVFGLGVLNIQNNPNTYTVSVTFSSAFDSGKNPLNDPNMKLLHETSISLESKEKQVVSIFAEVPEGTQKGTYIYNVQASPYTQTTKMYIIVD